jgi:hypothetical protein
MSGPNISGSGGSLKRKWEDPNETKPSKKARTELSSMIQNAISLAEEGKTLPSEKNQELAELFRKITAHADSLTAQDKADLNQICPIIKGLVVGTRAEVREVTRAINVLQLELKNSKRREREEEELPDAKRARPNPLNQTVENYLQGATDIASVLEEIFQNPSNTKEIEEKARYIEQAMSQVVMQESLFGKISNLASLLFYQRPRTSDPETLRIFAEKAISHLPTSEGNLYTFLDLLKHDERLPPDYYNVVITVLDKIVNDSILKIGCYHHQIDAISALVYNFSADQRDEMLQKIAPFCKMGHSIDFRSFLAIISRTPFTRLDEVIQEINYLVERNENLFFARNATPDTLIHTTSLMKKFSSDNIPSYTTVSEALAIAPKMLIEEREDVIACAISCFLCVPKSSQLEELARIPASDLKNIHGYAHSLRTDYMNNDEIIKIITTVAEVPSSEREETVALTKSLVTDRDDGYEKSKLISTIANMSRAERTIRIDLLKRFLKEDRQAYEIVSFLKSTNNIQTSELENVVEHARPWMGLDLLSLPNKGNFLKQIAAYRREERAHQIAGRVDVLRVIPEGGRYLPAFVHLPIDLVSLFVRHTQAFIEGLDSPTSISCSIEHMTICFNNLSERRFDECMTDILSLIRSDMFWTDRYQILNNAYALYSSTINPIAVDDDAYVITISRDRLEQAPRELLHALVSLFKEGTRELLRVRFIGEQGIDTGGLGRQFISELCDGICKELGFQERPNGLFRPELKRDKEGVLQPLSDSDKTTLEEMGELFMFCLNAEENYPIGMIFDQGVFEALTKFEERDPNNIGKRLSLYTAMNYSEDDQKYSKILSDCLKPLTDNTSEKVLRDAYAIVEAVDEIAKLEINYDLAKIKTHYPAIQAAILEDVIRLVVEPLIHIRNGMTCAPFQGRYSWQKIQGMSARELSEELQGVVTREMILRNLQYSDDFPEAKQLWVQNWIHNADDAKIKQFLFALTGSSSLGRKPLSIKTSKDNTFFYTCFNRLDMPIENIDSEELFVSLLDTAIAGKKYSAY